MVAGAAFTAVVSAAVALVAAAGMAAAGVGPAGAGPDGAVVAGAIGARAGAGAAVVELRLGLGLGSWLGDRRGDRARWGRDRFVAGLRRRSRLLGQAARLDGERPLYGPKACERLHVNLDLAVGRCGSAVTFQVEASKSVNLKPEILNGCSDFIANTCS
jgi:hypothetical protein